jgi:tetraacyldisaccharide 4'-kinase
MHAWLQRIWYAGVPPPAWLRALGALHGWLQRRRSRLPLPSTPATGAPVIVVGNLTVGGTGKTPVVIWLCEQLRGLGLNVAVISRGYGGRHARSGGVLRVEPGMDAALTGDEPLLIRRRTGALVYVARLRAAAAAQARAEGAQVIVADDGLQHRALARDCELVVMDSTRGFGNGLLLPAGPLREPATRLATVSAVILNVGVEVVDSAAQGVRVGAQSGVGSTASAARLPPRWPGALAMHLRGTLLHNLAEPARTRRLASLAGQRVHAVAALGNPERFFAGLRRAGLQVLPHALRDHLPIPAAALAYNDGLPVLMTEKDAVKCAALAHADCWYLPVAAHFSAADAHVLLRRVLMDARLLDLLACPVCKGPLRHLREAGGEELLCRADRLAFPVRDGIPVMLEEEARVLAAGDPLLER